MSEENPVKRKRGRPRKDTTIVSDAPRRTTRQRARQSHVPIMNVASFGKRDTPVVIQEEPLQPQNLEAPIILSLPVSDELENRNSIAQTTLVDEYMEYHPDVSSAVPNGVIDNSTIGSIYEGTSQHLDIQRCQECVSEPSACEECNERFNNINIRSFDDYSARRDQDFSSHTPPARSPSFLKTHIVDKPMDPAAMTEQTYNPNLLTNYGASISEIEPQGICSIDHDNAEHNETSELQIALDQIRLLKLELETAKKVSSIEPKEKEEIDIEMECGDNECLWHLGFFDTVPVTLPLYFNNITQMFNGIGPFCSLECAYAYRLEHRSAEAAPIRLLHLAHSMRSDYNGSPLCPAPPRQALKRFKGTMNLNTFLGNTKSWFDLSHIPFIIEPIQVDEVDLMYRSMSGVKSQAAPLIGTDLVKKREKPHPNAKNQWQASMQRSRLRKK